MQSITESKQKGVLTGTFDIPDETFAYLINISQNGLWKRFTSRGNHTRYIDGWPCTHSVPSRFHFLTAIYNLMIQTLQQLHSLDHVIPIELFICHYPDGTHSTGKHRHQCRSMTLSIGSNRTFQINTKQFIMHNGNFVTLYKHAHGVPKTEETGPRFSLNLFYCLTKDKNVSIHG